MHAATLQALDPGRFPRVTEASACAAPQGLPRQKAGSADGGDACYVRFMPRVRSALGQFYGSVRSVLCQFYGSVRSAFGQRSVRVRSVLCPPPTGTARAQATKQKYHKRRNAHVTPEFPYAHTVRGVQPPWWQVRRQRPTKRIWQGGEVCLAARRPRRTRKVIARSASFSFSLLLVSSLLVDRPRRGPPGAKRPRRLRCCASAAEPRCASLASCSPRSPLLWVSFNATPSIKLCSCLAGGGLAARRLAVCCLRLLERNGRWDGRPRAGLAARTLNPPIPIGAENCVLPCAG